MYNQSVTRIHKKPCKLKGIDRASITYDICDNAVKAQTVSYGQCSFRFQSVRMWNSLPNDTKKATDAPDLRLDGPELQTCYLPRLKKLVNMYPGLLIYFCFS